MIPDAKIEANGAVDQALLRLIDLDQCEETLSRGEK